jgi:hypothetical protein
VSDPYLLYLANTNMFKLIRDIDVSPIFTIFLLDFETEPEVLYFLVYIFVNFPAKKSNLFFYFIFFKLKSLIEIFTFVS